MTPTDLAGLCTGPGPCSPAPLGAGKNWVNKHGGLPLYIRAIANSLKTSGHSETDAITLAIGTVKRWAAGGGNVTPATRARAAKAVAEWERLKASAHDHTADTADTVDLAFTSLTSVTDGGSLMMNDMLKDPASVRKAAANVHKMPAPLRKKAAQRIMARAKQLGMDVSGITEMRGMK